MASNRRRKEKLIIVFDEKDRREFITGFRKRKNERRKKAQEELKQKEEEKRKQLRAEKREALRNQIQEYEEKLEAESEEEDVISPTSITHDFGEHTVIVATITDEDMGRDFLSSAHQVETQKIVNQNAKPLPNINGKTTREKFQLKKKFRKKAQKRKIQASGDKKSLKRKAKMKN